MRLLVANHAAVGAAQTDECATDTAPTFGNARACQKNPSDSLSKRPLRCVLARSLCVFRLQLARHTRTMCEWCWGTIFCAKKLKHHVASSPVLLTSEDALPIDSDPAQVDDDNLNVDESTLVRLLCKRCFLKENSILRFSLGFAWFSGRWCVSE